MARTVELSLRTFLSAHAQISQSDPHPIFAGGARFVPPSLQGRIDHEAFDELAELGLTRGEHLSDTLVDTFEILDRPQVLLHAYIRTGEEQYGTLVAGFDRDGVVAGCQDDRVWLRPMKRGDTHSTLLVRELPEYPSARFTPFSIAQEDNRSEEARQLKEILDLPCCGLGELHSGNTLPVSYLDTEDGRVGFALSGPATNRYITVFPGRELATRLG
ncbi:ESX secretion-associated protein EspG [Amycolatopsis sp.]|uniref:ESX secretion-associated protein EspG n=1 Tax=Amycolatopsis sp. TaxID=37632 RepID=UPI002B49908D|nr:ESX secretion-associated protein EspG [Amycolatopsis sp.]